MKNTYRHSWFGLYFLLFLPALAFIWFVSSQISFHLATLLLYAPVALCFLTQHERLQQSDFTIPLILGTLHGALHYFCIYDLSTIENQSFLDLMLHTLMLIYSFFFGSQALIQDETLRVIQLSGVLSLLSFPLFLIRHTNWFIFQLFRLSAAGHALSSGIYVSVLLCRALESPDSRVIRDNQQLFRTHLCVSVMSYIIMMLIPVESVLLSASGRYYESFFIVPCLIGIWLYRIKSK